MRAWIVFVSRRHLRTRRKERGHTASVLSVTGIAVGVMTLVAVLAVMNGFQLGTIQDILEVNSYHLRVTGYDSVGRTEEASRIIATVSGVRTAVPFVDIQALIRGAFSEPDGVNIRAVPVDVLQRDESLAERLDMVAGSFDVHGTGTVVLGSELARNLGVQVGDVVHALNLTGGELNLRAPKETSLQVTGIFRTGFLDFDQSWGFVSLPAVKKDFAAGEAPVVGVKLANRFRDLRAQVRIQARLKDHGMAGAGVRIVSWREYNRSIFGALRMEKVLMMVIVGLIFVVVGVNIFHALRRSVIERTEEIAVLKALGAPPVAVQSIFVIEGALIGLAGAVIGLAAGLLVAVNVNGVFALAETVVNAVITVLGKLSVLFQSGRGGFTIFSPAYFYITEVPTKIYFAEALGIFLFAIVSSLVAAYFAARRVVRIKPGEVLRYE